MNQFASSLPLACTCDVECCMTLLVQIPRLAERHPWLAGLDSWRDLGAAPGGR
jgi:hypothetical protein